MKLARILIEHYYKKNDPGAYKKAVAITPAVLKNEFDQINDLILAIDEYSELQYSRLLNLMVSIIKFKEALQNDQTKSKSRK